MQKIHESTAKATTIQEILPWRDLYRQEMTCQIIHDSLHSRKGWTEPYLLMSGGAVAGYPTWEHPASNLLSLGLDERV